MWNLTLNKVYNWHTPASNIKPATPSPIKELYKFCENWTLPVDGKVVRALDLFHGDCSDPEVFKDLKKLSEKIMDYLLVRQERAKFWEKASALKNIELAKIFCQQVDLAHKLAEA